MLTLRQLPGPYLPRGQDPSPGYSRFADQLRADAADIAAHLVECDRANGHKGDSTQPLPELGLGGDAYRDAARAHLRAEWIASRTR